jgi:hypothetical protein
MNLKASFDLYQTAMIIYRGMLVANGIRAVFMEGSLKSTFTPRIITCATTVDPDQLAQMCHLIWIYTGCFLVKNIQLTV